jgi:type IV secretory pathway TraG/TraD family ATPase VirD4
VLGERDHWKAAAQQLLAALILYVYTSPTFPPEVKDLPTVRRLLLGAADATLQAMSKTDLAGGLARISHSAFSLDGERLVGA